MVSYRTVRLGGRSSRFPAAATERPEPDDRGHESKQTTIATIPRSGRAGSGLAVQMSSADATRTLSAGPGSPYK